MSMLASAEKCSRAGLTQPSDQERIRRIVAASYNESTAISVLLTAARYFPSGEYATESTPCAAKRPDRGLPSATDQNRTPSEQPVASVLASGLNATALTSRGWLSREPPRRQTVPAGGPAAIAPAVVASTAVTAITHAVARIDAGQRSLILVLPCLQRGESPIGVIWSHRHVASLACQCRTPGGRDDYRTPVTPGYQESRIAGPSGAGQCARVCRRPHATTQ